MSRVFGSNSQPEIGIRGPVACQLAGITYRKLDYWDRIGLVQPSIGRAAGSGSGRRYSRRDVLLLALVEQLTRLGVSLRAAHRAIVSGAAAIPGDPDAWARLLVLWTPEFLVVLDADDTNVGQRLHEHASDNPIAVVALAPIADRIAAAFAAVTLEHTDGSANLLAVGPMAPPDDPAAVPAVRPAGEGDAVLDPPRDTAHVLTHAGGIQTSA